MNSDSAVVVVVLGTTWNEVADTRDKFVFEKFFIHDFYQYVIDTQL